MHQDGNLNGSTAVILYKLGRIEVAVETTQRDVHVLTRRLDTLEQPSRRGKLLDLSGWITGAIVLLLAVMGRWAELGAFLGRGN